MSHRTVELVDFATYLADPYGGGSGDSSARDTEHKERKARLAAFPNAVMLKLSYPELDFANRWCWQQFGPADGECLQSQSNYPACPIQGAHSHTGTWISYWLAKIDYDFGYNEWYFAANDDAARFLTFAPQINWGEKFGA